MVKKSPYVIKRSSFAEMEFIKVLKVIDALEMKLIGEPNPRFRLLLSHSAYYTLKLFSLTPVHSYIDGASRTIAGAAIATGGLGNN